MDDSGDHRRFDERGPLAAPVPVHRVRPRMGDRSRCRRRRQRLDGRHARARRERVPGRPRRDVRKRGLRARQQPGRHRRRTHAYALFLNPDTEILEGTFEDLVGELDDTPDVGLAGVKQVMPGGELFPTIRRFPNARRVLFEALGSENAIRSERRGSVNAELDLEQYETRRHLRLDVRLIHDRQTGGARERRISGRTVLHLLRGDRSLPAHQARRAGRSATCRQ